MQMMYIKKSSPLNVMNAFRDNVSVVYGDIEYVKFNDVNEG